MRCSCSEYTHFTATPPITGTNQGMTLTVNTDLGHVYTMTLPIIRSNWGDQQRSYSHILWSANWDSHYHKRACRTSCTGWSNNSVMAHTLSPPSFLHSIVHTHFIGLGLLLRLVVLLSSVISLATTHFPHSSIGTTVCCSLKALINFDFLSALSSIFCLHISHVHLHLSRLRLGKCILVPLVSTYALLYPEIVCTCGGIFFWQHVFCIVLWTLTAFWGFYCIVPLTLHMMPPFFFLDLAYNLLCNWHARQLVFAHDSPGINLAFAFLSFMFDIVFHLRFPDFFSIFKVTVLFPLLYCLSRRHICRYALYGTN